MIAIEHLSASYVSAQEEIAALADIHLQVPEGTICAIIGPSGCGKSTLLKILAGILPDYQGRILFRGENLSPKKHTIGFIPQNYGLLPWRTIADNILLGWKVKGGQRLEASAWQPFVSRLGIGEIIHRYPGEVSGGQQQRAGLARVFLLRPDILLMDEPFSALDAITREEIQLVFLELWREQGVTTFMVTHQAEEALLLGQKIVILSNRPGRIRRIIDNPLFGQRDRGGRDDFIRMEDELRRQLRDMEKQG